MRIVAPSHWDLRRSRLAAVGRKATRRQRTARCASNYRFGPSAVTIIVQTDEAYREHACRCAGPWLVNAMVPSAAGKKRGLASLSRCGARGCETSGSLAVLLEAGEMGQRPGVGS